MIVVAGFPRDRAQEPQFIAKHHAIDGPAVTPLMLYHPNLLSSEIHLP